MFGWLRVSDGKRRFRVALTLIPRKNAKSTLAAVVVLEMLVADGEGRTLETISLSALLPEWAKGTPH